jgi:DNA-binding transcriptional regulator LsrR (DeoR family)
VVDYEQVFSAERSIIPGVGMAVSREQHRLLYRIAQAYYVDELTQQQIAKRFGLSRPKVSRLLQKARDERIINITLVPPTSGMADLERELEHKYGLEEVAIVPVSDPQNPATMVRELGPAAAECLVRCISGKEIVGMTWGTSVLAMVDALPVKHWPDVTIVQMLGGLGPVDALEHSTELTQRVAQKFNAKLRLLPAPGIVSTRAAAQELRSNPQISETLGLAAKADVAVMGLGVPSPASFFLRTSTIIKQKDLELLEKAGAVGDIGLRYIDAYGTPLDLEINERLIGLTLEQIMNIPRVIGVAGGEVKYKVIRAALRGNILNVLVTDHVTAQSLLAEAN